jgi:peptidoglycan pentaglycine glycine transferase (the first glycine)
MDNWNDLISALPQPHFLQTSQWAQVKSRFGWHPLHQEWKHPDGSPRAAALVLQRQVPIPGLAQRLRILYAPRGPLLDWQDSSLRRQVLTDLEALARRQGAIFIKIDPALVLPNDPGSPYPSAQVLTEMQAQGWLPSPEQVQFRSTVLIDISSSDDELLARMKQKTRYNIRLAERRGVQVRRGDKADFPLLYRMYAETAARDGFVIREQGYYTTVWSTFMDAGMAEPLLAVVEGEPVAALVLFHFAGAAWYFYGMSRPLHREKMPNYLLQFEAMRTARSLGCRTYDLWGAPDVMDESDPLWGVYRFKEGLGGSLVRTAGAWDLPIRPHLYRLYTQTLPRLLDWMRRRGRERTKRLVAG